MPKILTFPDVGCAVVIGGSGGVGQEICTQLAAAGCTIALTYHKNAKAADEVVKQIVNEGGKCSATQFDAQEPDSVQQFLQSVAKEYGGIHTLVNAAGANIPMRFIGEISPQEWAEVIQSDLNGFFNLVNAALPLLRESAGSIIQLSSIGLQRWPKRDVLSVAPKAGIEALITGIASEEGRYGVRANSIQLGVIEAGLFLRLKGEAFDEKWVDAARNNTALKRFGTPADVANAVLFLASKEGSYITGQAIKMDGGYSL